MTSNFDSILIIVVKWKYSSFDRFRPTLKSISDYFNNHCAFNEIQIITTKRLVAFAFNCNVVHVFVKNILATTLRVIDFSVGYWINKKTGSTIKNKLNL